MASKAKSGLTWHPDAVNKKTSIGRGNIKRSSMNKHKKRNFKAYRGQGK